MGCNKSDGPRLVGRDTRVQGEQGGLGTPPDSSVTAILEAHTQKFEDILTAVQSIKYTLEPRIAALHIDVGHLREEHKKLKERVTSAEGTISVLSGQEFPYAPQLLLRVVPGGAISLRDPSLRAWEVAGIVEWGDLFEDHMLIPYDDLVNDFSLSPGTFMTYAAVTRQPAVRWVSLPREPDTSILLQTLLTHGGEKKAITNIYKALHMEARYPLTSLRAYWEDALHVRLTDT
ncbi:hypothetical protein NDU88_004125 [Pleurodeles waltl]|uniref:Uncharacterized protein n=1 Tax=Pleurodeles waltl TaxID=8319 RepID=A0AAV7NIL5_PLEWA|nr:hypothetical protein NDU88_004125 [Pleurodeles waltl]